MRELLSRTQQVGQGGMTHAWPLSSLRVLVAPPGEVNCSALLAHTICRLHDSRLRWERVAQMRGSDVQPPGRAKAEVAAHVECAVSEQGEVDFGESDNLKTRRKGACEGGVAWGRR